MSTIRFFHLAFIALTILTVLLIREAAQILRAFSWTSVIELVGIMFVAWGSVLVLLNPDYRNRRLIEIEYVGRRIAVFVGVATIAVAVGVLAALGIL